LEATIDALQSTPDSFATLDVGARESTLGIVNGGEVTFIRAALIPHRFSPNADRKQ
jgi:hypothetical protein